MLTIEPIQGIDYLFDEKDLVEVTTGGTTYSGVVLDVAGEVYVTHQTDDEIVYIPKEVTTTIK